MARSSISPSTAPLALQKPSSTGGPLYSLLPFMVAAFVVFVALLLLPSGTVRTTLDDAAGDVAPGTAVLHGETMPHSPFPEALEGYGMGVVAAAFLMGALVLTRGRLYP